MRRSQLLILVTAVSLAGFVILLAALTAAPVTALPYESPLGAPAEAMGQQLEVGEQFVTHLPNAILEPSLPALAEIQDQSLEPSAVLTIAVNYAEEWVAGSTDPSATVVVTVTDGGEDPQETATVSADGSGEFFVGCENWDSGNCPNIGPGDNVVASVVGATAEITTVGSIVGEVNTTSDVVTGTLNASWLPNPTDVECAIWEESGEVISDTTQPDGGTFTCDFSGIWDLQEFVPIALIYYEPDGDRVINMITWPWSRVNYAHDWVAGNYEAGHTFWITVTDHIGLFKASNATSSEPGLGWGAEGYDTGETPWIPEQPDIVPGDHVYITGDDGYTNTLEVGTIYGVLDIDADIITGTIDAPFGISLTVKCQPWGAWEQGMDVPQKSDDVLPNGTDQFECDWGTGAEWDIQPGQNLAVSYVQPDGDLIIDVYRVPASYLGIDKRADGAPAEGGNFVYRIDFWNDGEDAADNVVITDTMEGMGYLFDTSGSAVTTGTIPGGEYFILELGTVGPGEGYSFDVYASVESTEGELITNSAEIGTTTFDQGEEWENSVSVSHQVIGNDTHLNVGKDAWTGDPTPDGNFVFAVNVCNNGESDSTDVILEDLLQHPEISLNGWYAQHPGWYELYSDPGQLVVAIPSIPSYSCSEVYLNVYLDAGVQPGDPLFNVATITSTSDLEPEDNEAMWEGSANDPHLNLNIDKWLNWGVLVPGGDLSYGIGYGNDGNVPSGPVRITETLPAGTTFLGSWQNTPTGQEEFPPDDIGADYVAWEIDNIENGTGGNIEVLLLIDPGTAPGTTLENWAVISMLPDEDSHEDNYDSWIETVFDTGPNLRVFKRHDWQEGHRIDYQIGFANVGDEPAADVWLTDTMPADTSFDGGWHMEFDWERLLGTGETPSHLTWTFSEINPGESGWIYFSLDLDNPGTPLVWYANDVEITIPSGDSNPADNSYSDVAFSGGELWRVELWLETAVNSTIWGEAIPGSLITVTTPADQYYSSTDPDCGSCWQIDDIGRIYAGDVITVEAGDGIQPVVITIPDPFYVTVSSSSDWVGGQIGGWLTRSVEVHGSFGFQDTTTDGAGNWHAPFDDVPKDANGYIRFIDQIDYAEVVFHRPFWSWDVVLEVNYGHDWVQGPYPPGHSVRITVTESDGSTVKGAAQFVSDYLPEGDRSGFTTDWGWDGEHPDIQPGDWVYALTHNNRVNSVKVGDIDFGVDYDTDIVAGNLYADWITDPLVDLRCEIWGHPDGPGIDRTISPDGGAFECDFAADGINIEMDHTAAVYYWDEDGDLVINTFDFPAPDVGVWKWQTGNYAQPGSVVVYGIQYQNDGSDPADDVTIVDTFPSAYLSYAGDTSGVVPDIDPSGLITWHLGTVDSSDQRAFMVTFDVDPGAPPDPGAITENCVAISTATAGDMNSDNDSSCSGPVDLVPDEVEMGVNKGSNPGDPSPGQDFTYNIGICNNRGAAAGPVLLTDTLPAEVTLIEWWPQNWNDNYWNEVHFDAHELILHAPGFPGDYCDNITLLVSLDSGAEISTTIENLVEIDVSDDVDFDNNWQVHEAHISPPRFDLNVNKGLNGGSLVPGGNVGFSIDWQNQGNVSTTVRVTDTVPSGLSYVGGDWAGHTPWSGEPIPDPVVDGNQLIWNLPPVPVGDGHGFNIYFDIVAPDPVPELINCATVAGDGPDDSPEDNTDCDAFPVNPPGPNLAIEKWHEWNGEGQIQYNISFLNIGDQTIGDVWIIDTLPDHSWWNGWWEFYFDWNRLVGGDVIHDGNQLKWNFTELYPGDQGHIQFAVDLEFPGEPLRWYTNTVEITLPPGDTNPGDNFSEDVAFSGSAIRWVDLNVYGENIWGYAAVGPLTITTQYEEEYFGGGDFDWHFNQPFLPGEVVTLTAGAGQMPVVIQIPDPFDVEGSSVTDIVQGQIDHLDSEWIEVGLDGGSDLLVQTDGAGFFSAIFPDIPRGGTGEVRYRTIVNYTDVTFHRGWSSPDLILEVNYGHDWVQGSYEPGHTVWITVTNEAGSVIKGTAELQTHDLDGWFGFNTDDGWDSDHPNIEPFDWVYGKVDNGFTSEVQIFQIDGFVDPDLDLALGALLAPWYIGVVDFLDVTCEPWGAWDQGEWHIESKYSQAPPDGHDPFLCEWAGEWDIELFQEVGVRVADPDGDQVLNVLAAEAVDLKIDKWNHGNYARPGGVQLYQIYYRNRGNAVAENVIITDTLPMYTTYAGDTGGWPVSIGAGGVITWELGALEPDGEGQIWVTLAVDPGAPTGEGVLEPNCVTMLTSTEPEFEPGDNSACSDPVDVWDDEVEIGVDKGTNPGDPTPGQPFHYSVQWCNNRGATAGPVWMTDTLPVEALFVGWGEEQDWQQLWTEISFDGAELVLYAPALPGDTCERVNIYMELPPHVTVGTTMVNEVVIYTEGDVEPGNNVHVHEFDVSPPRQDLSIYKEYHNGVLAPEGWINYFINFSNDGNVVSGVNITETIPAGLTFNGAWWGGGQPDEGQPLPEPVVDGDKLIWDFGAHFPSQNRWFHVEFSIDPETNPGEFDNCVEISGDTPDLNPENNVSCETVTTFPSGPNVRVVKQAYSAHEGARIDYQITFYNVGDVPIFNHPFTDTFPTGTIASNQPENDYYYPIHTIDMTGQNQWGFVVEEIHPGDQGNIWFQVELENPEPGRFYTNTVEAGVLPGEVDESDNAYVTLSTTGPDLFVEKELVDGELLPGELITFSLTFGNDRYGHEWWWGLHHNAVLTDTLPSGLEFVSAAMHYCGPGGFWCNATPDEIGDKLVWDLWPIGSGGGNELLLTLRITDTAEGDDIFTNWAEIQSSIPSVDVEPFYHNNTDSADVVIALPKFEVSKISESSQVAGMTVAYTITVENTGSEPGTNVVLSDTLPVGLDYGGGDGTFDGTAVTWTFPEILEDGGTASGTFTATLPCTGTIANDDYLVVSSDKGVSSESGPAVEFDITAPTINTSIGHTLEPIVVGSTVYFTATGVTDGTDLTYAWDYGDGGTGAGEFTNHQYTSDAAFTVVLTSTDSCLYETNETVELTVDPPAFAATFDQSASAIPIHSMVYFTDTSTSNGPAIVEWEWDFGDGSAAAATQDASHLYSAFGTFDVTLVVTDELGYSDSILVVDAVTTLAPVFEIGKEYDSSEVAGTLVTYTLTFTNIGSLTGTGLVITDALPANVTWVNGGSYDVGTGIISWPWSSLSPGSDANVQFVGQLGCSGQAVNDSYQVASSDQGSSSPLGDPVSFTIQNPTISASFIQSASAIVVGESVVFTSTSSTNGSAIVSWLWDFGDTITDTGEVVSRVYDEVGIYDVQLTVTDACGNSDTITVTDAVEVEESEFFIYIPFVMKPQT